jgi:small subunit ribosomal protein S4
MKLYLKSERCYTERCSFDRNQYPPGQHGQARVRVSEYGLQLREKQKVKRMYGVLEKQFRRYFKQSVARKGPAGENLLDLLEGRLDNTVFRLGMAGTRAEARQLVRHGHIMVNGHKVNIPSYQVSSGDEILVREKARKQQRIVDSLERALGKPQMSWLELDKDNFLGKVTGKPVRAEIPLAIQETLIVELYSR